MNELSSLGLILLLALLAGHLVKFLRIPEVTGYILAGVALGPSVLGWVSHENLAALSVFSEVALGLILFSIGSVFDFSRFLQIGRRIVLLTFLESSLTAVLVATSLLVAGLPWQVALLLGSIAVETAVASTLMVLRELRAKGPLSETLMGIIAVNNILCLVGYSLVASFLDLTGSLSASAPIFRSLYTSLYPLLWQIVGSIALGYLVGVLLASWASKVVEHGEILILLAGSILLCVGVAGILELSPLLSSLVVGTTMVNLSDRSRHLFETLTRTDPPLYAIFFVIAGADLNISLLGTVGVMGGIYVLARVAGKFLGAVFGTRWLTFDPVTQRLLGFCTLTQAGLAIGLTLVIHQRFPEYAPIVSTIILSAIIIFEMVGPISTRLALVRGGEAQAQRPKLESVFE